MKMDIQIIKDSFAQVKKDITNIKKSISIWTDHCDKDNSEFKNKLTELENRIRKLERKK